MIYTTVKSLIESGMLPKDSQDIFNMAANGKPITVTGATAEQDYTIYSLHKASIRERDDALQVLSPTPTPAEIQATNNDATFGKYDSKPSRDDGFLQGLLGAAWGKVFSDPNI